MRQYPPLDGNPGDPFIDANPIAGIPGSPVPAEAFNAPRDELVNVILTGGLMPDEGDNTQVAQAIDAIVQAAVAAVSSGVVSVNGQSGVVTIDIPVTSVNGQTGAVVIAVPVNSVNGQAGTVVLDADDVGGVPTARQVIAGTGLTGGGSLLANRTINADFADATQIRNGTANKIIAPNVADSAASEVSLTFGSTVNWPINAGFSFFMNNITSNFTMANPTNQVPGRTGTLRLGASVERTISWGSAFLSAKEGGLPTSVVGEIVLGWANSYSGRIFIG